MPANPLQAQQEQINALIVDHYLELDKKGNFKNPPKNDDELWEFIALFYGFRIPRKIVTPGHRAPFEFVADLYFERVKNALGFANRTGGKTLSVAILNHLDMIFKRGCEVASVGSVLYQAEKCYRYFTDFCELPRFKEFCKEYERVTGNRFMVKQIQSWTEFGNGSTQEILTATEKGLRSPHPNKARIDEIDLLSWQLLQTGLSMAQSSGSIRGQNVFTSTRQYQQGSMQRLLDEAPEKGIEVYEWNCWEVLEKCQRRCLQDPVHGDCKIYTFCKGKAHHCDGFYKIDDFIDKVRILDRDSFETEWLNLRPARHKLVYHMFEPSKHVMTPKKLHELTGYSYPSPYWRRICGIDFGSSPGHPFTYVKVCQLPSGQFLAFFEYGAEQRLLRDHAISIKRSPHYISGEFNYADHDAQDRLELKALGVNTRPAAKDVLMGIDYISTLLSGRPPIEAPDLFIWYECKMLLQEFGMYQFPTLADGKIDRSGNPIKQWDNYLDALRYALYSSRNLAGTRYRVSRISGV